MMYINKVGQKKRQKKLKLVAVNLHPGHALRVHAQEPHAAAEGRREQ